MTDELWTLIETCWHHDASARPTFKDIVPRLASILLHTNSKPDYEENLPATQDTAAFSPGSLRPSASSSSTASSIPAPTCSPVPVETRLDTSVANVPSGLLFSSHHYPHSDSVSEHNLNVSRWVCFADSLLA